MRSATRAQRAIWNIPQDSAFPNAEGLHAPPHARRGAVVACRVAAYRRARRESIGATSASAAGDLVHRIEEQSWKP
jgi:hypothetical protein